MSNLVIELSGLCGCVPRRATPTTPDYAVTVLMISREVQGNVGLEDLHVPALIFPDAARDTTAGLRGPDEFFYDQYGNLMGVCWLDGQEISVSGLTSSFTIDDGSIGTCPTNADRSYFSWAAPMAKIDARWGTVDSDCLLPVPDSAIPNAVGARVQLASGELFTKTFFGDNQIPYRCGFVSSVYGTSAYEQAIADELELIASAGATITFSARSLRGTATYPDLKLNIGSSDLLVGIKDLPVLEILGYRPAPKIILGQPPDDHFEHLFRFADNGPSPGDGYVYFPIALCGGTAMVQSPWCPPARFDPVVG